MGDCTSKATTMTQDLRNMNLDVNYGQASGKQEASTASEMLTKFFPNAKVNMNGNAPEGAFIINKDGKEVYNKQAGDGPFTKESAMAFAKKMFMS